jgi:pyruvate,water dikinase
MNAPVMSGVSALAEAFDVLSYGPKAVQLGAALRAGLPVPDGFALSHEVVSAVGCGGPDEVARFAGSLTLRCDGDTRWAVRSSAVGEDSPTASFAGVHLSVLGVRGARAIAQAVRDVHASAGDAGAAAYRDRMGLDLTTRMAVIVQELIDADVAGVMFTRNPVTGADERVIEASWGLGESVVSGIVTPDRYVLDRSGRLVERRLGEKDLAIRSTEGGGTTEEPVAAHLVSAPCLDERDLAGLHALALRCDAAYGSTEHDIEFAICAGTVRLLQRRPITRV